MHPELLSLCLFMFVTSCSPGPNNIVASHSGFNHGFKKTIPLMLGVIFGFTFMLAVINFGLINIFKIYPIIQKGLIFTGTAFLIYLSYKISFPKSSDENEKLRPVNFMETFLYQFLNPKGVIVAIIAVSTYVESGSNFISYSIIRIYSNLLDIHLPTFFNAFSSSWDIFSLRSILKSLIVNFK